MTLFGWIASPNPVRLAMTGRGGLGGSGSWVPGQTPRGFSEDVPGLGPADLPEDVCGE